MYKGGWHLVRRTDRYRERGMCVGIRNESVHEFGQLEAQNDAVELYFRFVQSVPIQAVRVVAEGGRGEPVNAKVTHERVWFEV
jgi:hypothetical protein